jgi:condensin complex subunit 1
MVDSIDPLPKQEEQYKSGNRFKAHHPVFEKLAQLVKDENAVIPIRKWFSAAEQALNTIYCISENPDQLATKIVRDMTKSAAASLLHLKNSDHFSKNDNSTKDLEMENTNQIDQNRKSDNEAILNLTRLFFVVGHVALKQLVYIEEIYKELEKRREKERGDKSSNKDSESNSKEAGKRKSVLHQHDSQQHKKQRKRVFGNKSFRLSILYIV